MIENNDWIFFVAAFACAFGVTLLTTPFAKKLSYKLNAIDHPRERGMHQKSLPRLGGVAIVTGFLSASAVMSVFIPDFRTLEFLGFIIGALIIVISGIFDDIYDLKPWQKALFQVAAALVVIFTGTRIEIVVWPVTASMQSFGAPVTFLWILGMTNAINYIDGLDGLAAGVSAIGALCLMVLCTLSGSPLAVVLSAMLAGSCIGFLPKNFNPAEIIMGDTGALFLGYVLAVSSIMGVFKGYTLLAMLVVFFAMAFPIFDIVRVSIQRVLKRKSPVKADKGHLHHRLIDSGYSQKRAVFMLYGLSSVTAVIAIVIAVQDIRAIIVTTIFLMAMLCVLYLYRKRTDKSGDTEENPVESTKTGIDAGTEKNAVHAENIIRNE